MKKLIALALSALLLFALLTGCAQKPAEPAAAEPAQPAAEAPAEAPADEEASAAEPAEEPAEEPAPAKPALPDGVYTAEFNTDSSMFHANEACDGKGTLTVKDGSMTIHVSLASKSIVNLFYGLAEDAQAYNDYAQKCERFEKKLHDLELTRMVSLQMGPQTRLLQNNDTLMVEKIQSSLVNTIPLWKSQMVLALGMEHSRQATAAQNAVTEMTNELLRKNADTLKMGTINTAKEAERSIVDIETLQHTNQQLIESLDEVARIQQEGAAKRREAEAQLGRIEGELKQKLLELRG